MNEPSVAKPWFATTAAGVSAAVDKLKHDQPEALFVLLTRAAASGEWDTFLPAFERVSAVKGIKLLLPAPDGFPMHYAYDNAGLPAEYWPIFVAVLEVAARVAGEAGNKIKAGKQLRELVIERAMSSAAVHNLPYAGRVAALLAG